MWVWPAIGLACGFAASIILGPLPGLFCIVGAFFLSDAEHRAETAVGAALGTAAGLGLLAAVSDVGQASHFRLGP